MRQHDDNSRQIVPHFSPASLGYDLERKLCLELAFFGLRMAGHKKKKAFKFMNLKALASDWRSLSPSLAEREGFEPPEPRSSTVFKTAAIDHSAISPGTKI